MKRLFEWDEFETEDEIDDPSEDHIKKMFDFLSQDEIQILKNMNLEIEQYNYLWDMLDGYGETRYDEGHSDGYNEGHEEGHDDGYDEGYSDGYKEGYDEGHDDGLMEGESKK